MKDWNELTIEKMKDWNELTIEESVHHLRKRYGVDSSGDARCIFKLIEFYEKVVKNNVDLANVSHRRELLKLKEFAERQQNIPKDIYKIVNDNFWDII